MCSPEEIPPERMSAATGFYTTFQQLLLSVGVSLGAVALHMSMASAGRAVPPCPISPSLSPSSA